MVVIMMTERQQGSTLSHPYPPKCNNDWPALPSRQKNIFFLHNLCHPLHDSSLQPVALSLSYPLSFLLTSHSQHYTHHIDFSASSCSDVFILNSCLSITLSHSHLPPAAPISRDLLSISKELRLWATNGVVGGWGSTYTDNTFCSGCVLTAQRRNTHTHTYTQMIV